MNVCKSCGLIAPVADDVYVPKPKIERLENNESSLLRDCYDCENI